MKKLFLKIKNMMFAFCRYLWTECKDVKTLLLFGIVCLVISAPIWIGYILGFIFNWQAAFWFATIIWGFWLLPGAPFFAVAIAATLGIKKLFRTVKKRRRAKNANAAQANEPSPESKNESESKE